MTMRHEIGEQPDVFREALGRNTPTIAEAARWLGEQQVAYALIAARGTSDNAARYAKYVWGARNRLPVALAAPSLFTGYASPPALEGALVVGISQSGASPDLVEVLAEGRRQGRPTLAITNAVDSPLTEHADRVIDIRAGAELAVAATKTYTAELLAIAMLSVALGGGDGADALAALPAQAEQVLGVADQVLAATTGLLDMRACAVLGRGYNLSTAFEWALKLQEITYAVAHPYSTADFRHGPIALAEPGFPVLAAFPDGPLLADLPGLAAELTGRGATTVFVSNREEVLDAATHGIPLPSPLEEWTSPLVAGIAAQLFTYHLGDAKGLDTTNPRGLRKVTLTE